MAAVHRERREHREHPIVEDLFERVLPLVVEIRDAHDPDVVIGERGNQGIVEQFRLLVERRAQPRRDRGEMFGRRAPVLGSAHHLRFDLLLDRGDANHEELVEIGSVDRDEL